MAVALCAVGVLALLRLVISNTDCCGVAVVVWPSVLQFSAGLLMAGAN